MAILILKEIFGTKKEIKIMIFFLTNPERSFFIGELRRRLGANNLAIGLGSLVRQGFVSSFAKKNKRYYQVNKKHPLYQQLKGATSSVRRSVDELIKILNNLRQLKLAVLTGLFAANPKAYCDILLVGNVSKRQVNSFARSAERLMGQEINYALISKTEFDLRKNTFDRFMKDIFEKEHLVALDKTK